MENYRNISNGRNSEKVTKIKPENKTAKPSSNKISKCIETNSLNHFESSSTKPKIISNDSQLIPMEIFATTNTDANFTYNTLLLYLWSSTDSEVLPSKVFDLPDIKGSMPIEKEPRGNSFDVDNRCNLKSNNFHYDVFDIKSMYSSERDHKVEELKDTDVTNNLPTIKSNISILDYFSITNNSESDVDRNDDTNSENKEIESIYSETLPEKALQATNSANGGYELLDDLLFRSFTIQPSTMMGRTLDDTGKLFLQYFQIEVSRLVTVGTQKTNYFLLTYFKMSEEPAISHSLAAWGGYYLLGAESNHQVQYHLKEGNKLIQQFLKSKRSLSKQDYFMLICFYLVQLGTNACTGEVSEWKIMFDNIRLIIEKFGGIKNLCEAFNYSNDIKFFLLTFGYHDIMSSNCALTGTAFPVEDYRAIHKQGAIDYGVDPLHGCNHEIYLLLGELMNLKVRVNDYQKQMDLYSSEDNFEKYEYTKLLKLNLVETKVKEISDRFADAKPNNYLLKLTGDDFELHLKVYDLYTLSSKMYCMTYIQQIPPVASDIQILVIKVLKLIKELRNTRMNIILCFPLLMCGISSVSAIDRMHMESVIVSLISAPIDNISKALIITKEAWKRNPQGNLIIDWADICDDFGWSFSPC